ncbi:J domain-containing protein [Alteraurantiacibacter buctensis]|uniref:Molecular chaperone DnaJ n=1 Tax=Alteraurantiacibacter buctensis TaxID=1503981 RepID=A0A844YU42_9SPHN|nr:J domain-containing protein [Alteraurantiacibacter buctensis]MXO70622.1 molecular chaperone DnaJ [Alteraurantiacibacter buctensis]
MTRLLFAAGVICLLFRMITGRWPWQPKVSTRQQAVLKARSLLGVDARAGRDEIVLAHRRLVALVHPDKGGTNSQVHEANAARDLLLNELPGDR